MLYGVQINTTRTLDDYGLCLMSNLSIPAPTIKDNLIDVPGADGTINASYILTGGPVFNNIEITFSLFKRAEERELHRIRSELMNAFQGRMVDVFFPTDTEHYYSGVIMFGEISDYNSGIIPVRLLASPWKMKSEPTTVARSDLSTSYKQLQLPNERRPVVPSITVAQTTTLLWNGNTYTVNAGTHRLLDIQLQQGANLLKAKVSSGTGSISVTYQEASL